MCNGVVYKFAVHLIKTVPTVAIDEISTIFVVIWLQSAVNINLGKNLCLPYRFCMLQLFP